MPDRESIERARRLRQEQSPPEAVLWSKLRDGRLAGLKFRRQHPVGPYIVDFFNPAARLVIEIDGRIHERHPAKDRERDRWMKADGIRVLRIPAHEVSRDLDAVLRTIHRKVSSVMQEQQK